MMFWDSSALVPLIAEEISSAACRELLRKDPAIAVWALTRTEMISAIRRKQRGGELTRDDVGVALGRIGLLEAAWTEVDALAAVRDRADRLLGVHQLRAADALQLGAVLVLVEERPTGCRVVTADTRLGHAAAAEGFAVEIPSETPSGPDD